MENFSLSAASGWQTLWSLLAADSTFKGKYLWDSFQIRNTHASQTMIVKNLPGATAPVADSGANLTATGGAKAELLVHPGVSGYIDGKAIWIKASGAATTFDITFVVKAK